MRVVVQRVSTAAVVVDGQEVGRIGAGLLILLGIRTGDTLAEARYLARKCVEMRIFTDPDGRLNLAVGDVGGAILVVSQFTLYADCRRGRRPSFVEAAEPALSEPLYEAFVAAIRELGIPVACGVFGAHMAVNLTNDGPVTVIVDRNPEDGA